MDRAFLGVGDQMQEKPKAFDDKAKSHQRDSGSLPSEKRAFGCEKGPGIARVGRSRTGVHVVVTQQ